MAPSTTKQWQITDEARDFGDLALVEAPLPPLGDSEVLIKIEAVSLNYRDVAMPKGLYPFPKKSPLVPASDGAGEVIEVGAKVTTLKKGDKVATLFSQLHQYGPSTKLSAQSALGGNLDGVLRQYAVFPEYGLVKAPRNLTALEVSTLSCAGVTAWDSLYGLKPLKPGQVVLVQGSGGVSVFALQFAKAAGATVIATTSSAAKAEKLKKLGADYVINYKEDKKWGETARSYTPDGVGVDHVIDVGGESTLEQSLAAIKIEGIISLIGFLGGFSPKQSLLECLSRGCIARGVRVGSKATMEEMVVAIEANDLHPAIDDRVFGFEEVKEAYAHMWSQKQFGKIVIKVE
ncbi:Zinc-type alcohol dehydrogenase-like protein [Pleurostoma richardsiae]|uniref:Zinc-type alcohol dehydrogenase-like protein n=1 Tax=Pleurostoma richardsiae TaxID=41990 RepID=A0AA38RHZ8_9PEZI|nr:Zinc-type alcohol dehydrogenase-like protein [Pleurostoma richardsiae]